MIGSAQGFWRIGAMILISRPLWAGAVAAVCFLFIVLIIFVRTLAKAEREGKKAKGELLQKSEELQKANIQMKESKEELSRKYEELKQLEEKNRKIAYTDYITGIPNRLSFVEMLDSVLKTLRKEEQFALIGIDIDNFKRVNEALGHSYGDELLIDVADRLKQALDENDYMACLGADAFVILSQNMEDVNICSEKIKKIQKLFTFPFNLAAQEFFTTVSIGACIAPKDGKTSQTLQKNMDAALHMAKLGGKNTYCYYDETMNQNLMEKIELQSQLRNAIENREFQVYYQPLVDLSNGELFGMEALVRWNHPIRGLLLPADFLPIAEETGLMVTIGGFVLETACQQLKRWMDAGFEDIQVAVNLTSRQFRDGNFQSMICSVLEKTGADPKHLELEISEGALLFDPDYSVTMLQQLREVGFSLTLDRFGTDYASLNDFKKFPVDRVKIDRSFLEQLPEEPEDKAVTEAVLHVSEALQVVSGAIGVESGEQEEFLKATGCRFAQGFWYSEPLKAEDASNLLNFLREGRRLEEFYL